MYKLVVPEVACILKQRQCILGGEKQSKYKLNVLMEIVILMREIGYSKDKWF